MFGDRGLRGLIRRALRPIAQPILRRLEIRMRTAVTSGFDSRFQALEAALARTSVSIALALEGRLSANQQETNKWHSTIMQRLEVLDRVKDVEVRVALLAEQLESGIRAIDSISSQMATIRTDAELLLNRHVVPLPPRFTATRTPFGYVAVPAADLQLIIYLCEGILPEPGSVHVFRFLLRDGDFVLDVGANVGWTTLALASFAGPTGKVISVEPIPATVEALRATLMINGLNNRVDVHQSAAADREGPQLFHCFETSTWSSMFGTDQSGDTVQASGRPLDQMVPAGTRVALAKIDVEGAELLVLAGMRRIINDSPDLALVVEFGPAHLDRAKTSPEAWFQAFRAAGFDQWYRIDDPSGRCRPIDGPSAVADVQSVNLLMTRAGSDVNARLVSSPLHSLQ